MIVLYLFLRRCCWLKIVSGCVHVHEICLSFQTRRRILNDQLIGINCYPLTSSHIELTLGDRQFDHPHNGKISKALWLLESWGRAGTYFVLSMWTNRHGLKLCSRMFCMWLTSGMQILSSLSTSWSSNPSFGFVKGFLPKVLC
jgi:hypothetical protein